MGKYTKMSQQVLEKVGGLSNITFVERCATRLRIHYASKSKVDVEAIKGIENVVGVVAKPGADHHWTGSQRCIQRFSGGLRLEAYR